MTDSQPQAQRPSRFRKQLLLPAEHGSWSWLLVPFLVGTAVAELINLPILLVLVGGLAFFLLRQPATVLLRVRQGKGRRSDGPLAQRLLWILSGVMLVCAIGLVWYGRFVMVWLLLPFAVLMVAYMQVAQQPQSSRSLPMELIGGAALALMAPAAMLAAIGTSYPTVWLVWGLMAAQNVLGVFYVRQRIADTHERPFNRQPVLWSHVVGLLIVGGTAVAGLIPWLAIVPFAGFLLRALWAFQQPRPVSNIKAFGFLEVGIELLSGAFIAAGYLL
ncbi:YwiC-like family protein [Candidatus Leptofilum sp.]|uniref:YwiC-like family protein n=1 Tax=Candidatus Leptofilum sp. TaxID=3241576 RepID=UPI003B5A83BC